MSDTSLAFRQATGQDRVAPKVTPKMAFERASELFVEGARLDMAALAQDLGVARATLYRWTGDRDRLLSEIVWFHLDTLITVILQRADGRGATRLRNAVTRYIDVIANAPAMRGFIVNEGESAVRMVTALNGPVRPKLVDRLTEVIEGTEGYTPPAPPAVLADGIVALGERYLHNGGDPSLNPDPATARTIIGLLLREDGAR